MDMGLPSEAGATAVGDGAPRIASWADAQALGMTCRDAARALGRSVQAGYAWARYNRKDWAKVAQEDKRKPGWWLDGPTDDEVMRLYGQGKRLRQVIRWTGLTEAALLHWAEAHGLSWDHVRVPVPDAAPDLDDDLPKAEVYEPSEYGPRPAYDDSDVDPIGCQRMWQNLILVQRKAVAGAWDGQKRSPDPDPRALRWFWSEDAAIVVEFAGWNLAVVQREIRALAVEKGLMQPGQVRP